MTIYCVQDLLDQLNKVEDKQRKIIILDTANLDLDPSCGTGWERFGFEDGAQPSEDSKSDLGDFVLNPGDIYLLLDNSGRFGQSSYEEEEEEKEGDQE